MSHVKITRNRPKFYWMFMSIFTFYTVLWSVCYLMIVDYVFVFQVGNRQRQDCVCVCVCVAALHWQHVWNGGGCLSLVSASFGPGWSRSVSFCTSRPSSSLRCTAHTYCPQSPQVRHYTSPSLSHTHENQEISESFSCLEKSGILHINVVSKRSAWSQ